MGDLFDWKPPLMTEPRAHKGVDTSEAAAESMKGCSGPMQRKILAYAKRNAATGITYDEVCIDLRMEKPTAAGRINDLTQAGFLVDSGERRLTRSGRKARVYVLTEQGKNA